MVDAVSMERMLKADPLPPYFSKLGVMLSWKCDIACRHCSQGESHLKTSMDKGLLESFIRQAAQLGSTMIGFTGGEPFLEYALLSYGAQLCTGLGITATVVTNGRWAVSQEKCYELLAPLTGIRKVSVSHDEWHAEFVPLESVIHIITACQELGKEVSVGVSHLAYPEAAVDSLKQALNSNGLASVKVTAQPIMLRGRAKRFFRADQLFEYPVMDCRCKTASIPLLLPDGTLFACCGAVTDIVGSHFLNLGNVTADSVAEIKNKAENNLVLQLLRVRGPGAILRALTRAGFDPITSQITGTCDICADVCLHEQAGPSLAELATDIDLYQQVAIERLLWEGDRTMLQKCFLSQGVNVAK
jgi:MoaA/NifB/PqqE/SkfB family radical SAM enzyme